MFTNLLVLYDRQASVVLSTRFHSNLIESSRTSVMVLEFIVLEDSITDWRWIHFHSPTVSTDMK